VTCRICEMMTLNEIHYNFTKSTILSVICLDLKSHYRQSMILHIESNGGYVHHTQLNVVHYYIEKESWQMKNQNPHVLSYCVVLSQYQLRVSKYEPDFSDSVVSFNSSSSRYTVYEVGIIVNNMIVDW
jgi:hypothetical protein